MKERLTGAIILVALVVLLVPELLTGPIRAKSAPPAASTADSAPAARAGRTAHAGPPLRTYTLTLGPAPRTGETLATPAVPAQSAQSAGGASDGPPDASAAGPALRSREEPGRSSRQEPPRVSAAGRTGAPEGGAASADAVSHAPRAGRPPRPVARTDPGLQAAKSPAHRTVQEAASASTGGWVVQLGSFADHQNATRLARSLRHRGFRISVSRARAGSRVLWRVRTVRAQDRAAAQRLAARLRKLGHPGELVPVR